VDAAGIRERKCSRLRCVCGRKHPQERGNDISANDKTDPDRDLDGTHHCEPEGTRARLVRAGRGKPGRKKLRKGLHGQTKGGENYGVKGVHRRAVSNKGRLAGSLFYTFIKRTPCQPRRMIRSNYGSLRYPMLPDVGITDFPQNAPNPPFSSCSLREIARFGQLVTGRPVGVVGPLPRQRSAATSCRDKERPPPRPLPASSALPVRRFPSTKAKP
jgi:hypothetical protein